MIIKFKPNTVTPYGFSKSSEEILYSFESIKENVLTSGVYSINNPDKRGNISELSNSLTFELSAGEVLNKVNAVSKLRALLTEKGFNEVTDYEFIQAINWNADKEIYPIRITLDKDFVLEHLTAYIAGEKLKGYPVIYNTTTIVLYVSQILPEHREILNNTTNAYIEE
jgi:hypothetical protein